MRTIHLLALLFAVAVVALGLWSSGWLAGPVPQPEPAVTAAPAPAPAPAVAAPGDVPERAAVDASSDPARVAVAAERADESGPALVGRVIDDKGAPIAAAEVGVLPDLGFGDEDVGEILADANDQERWRARVRAALLQRVVATTDADGRFRVRAAGTSPKVNVVVRARGHAVVRREPMRAVDRDTDLGELVLARSAVLSGRVVDAQSRGVAGARIQRDFAGFGTAVEFGGDDDDDWLGEYGIGGERTVTDGDGRFELPFLAPGDLVLAARHRLHPIARSQPLLLRAGTPIADVLIVVPPGAAIAGRLLGVPAAAHSVRVLARTVKSERAEGDPTASAPFQFDGEGLGDFGLQFGERSARPGADGAFELTGLQVGRTYRIWAAQSGRGFGAGALCSQQLEVLAGSTGLELRYDLGVTVSLRVVDARTDAPVERLWIDDRLVGGGGMFDFMQFAGAPRRSVRYADGRVVLTNLRPKPKQTLTVTIAALGYASWSRTDIVLPAGGDLDLGTVRLASQPTVGVRVVDAVTGRPLAGAKVRVVPVAAAAGAVDVDADETPQPADEHPTLRGVTDAEGRCTLNGLVGVPIAVVAKAAAHASAAEPPFTVREGEAAERELRLVRGGTVDVTVLDAAGQPVQGARIEHREPPWPSAALADEHEDGGQETDGQGRARFAHQRPGVHGFRVGVRQQPFQFQMSAETAAAADFVAVTVQDEQVAVVELRTAATARLRGIVRVNGIGLEGARVTLSTGQDAADETAERLAGMLPDDAAAHGAFGGNRATARTDAEGAFELAGIEVGEHRLRIAHKRRAMASIVPITVVAGEQRIDIALETAVLRGVVRGRDGRPIAKAKVRARRAPSETAADAAMGFEFGLGAFGGLLGGSDPGEVATGDDGTFELSGVEPDQPLLVTASAKGHIAGESARVQVARGATADGIAIELAVGGAITVTLTEAAPFAMATATWAGDGDVAPQMQQVRGKECTFDGLRPGRWSVSVNTSWGDGEEREPRVVEVVAGATVTVAL